MMDYKDIEVKGRNWRIVKFDARTGSKIVKKLLPVVAGFLKDTDLKATKLEDIKINVDGIVSTLNNLSDDDFDFIQTACLKVVSEAKGAGFIPMLNENGSFGVMDIDTDTATVLSLTAHALIFNVTGFFQGSPLASILGGLVTSSQQNS